MITTLRRWMGLTTRDAAPGTLTWSDLVEVLQGPGAAALPHVTPATAMKIGAVRACVRIISTSIARMPLHVYQITDAGRERAVRHPLYTVLRRRFNPDSSSFASRTALLVNALLWGNGYAELVRDRRDRIAAIYPIESWRVRPHREAGELRYRVSTDRGEVTLLKRDILHVPGLSFDGVCGLSVIADARKSLASSIAADEFSANFMARGLKPSGVLKHPGKISKEAKEVIARSFQDAYAGPANAGKPIVLEEGMLWEGQTMPMVDAQFVESSYVRIEDICRWFGVQPHKVQHLLRSTNNNIEQQNLDFLGDTLAPWIEAVQEEMNWKLFDEDERGVYYVEHLTQSIVQLDTAARVTLYKGLRDTSAMSPDEIRERENLNRLPDGRGGVYTMPSSLMPVPTPDQADRLLEAWIRKGVGGKADPARPDPKADDQQAKA